MPTEGGLEVLASNCTRFIIFIKFYELICVKKNYFSTDVYIHAITDCQGKRETIPNA